MQTVNEQNIVQNNVYVDTNIIIDICDKNRPTHKESLEYVTSLLEDSFELYINSDTLSNLFYILRTQSKETLSVVLGKMREISTIFTLVETTSKEIEEALLLCENNTQCKDYEDTLQYVCAKKISAKMIVTNDKKFVFLDIELMRTKK